MGRHPRDWIAVSVIAAILAIAAVELVANADARIVRAFDMRAAAPPVAESVSIEFRWD